MKIKILITIICCFALSNSIACLNEHRVTINGEVHTFDNMSLVPNGQDFESNKKEYEANLIELDSLWKITKQIEHYSDYGVNLVYLGRYSEAKNVFLAIEKQKPGLYATAANLGTVYELLGENKLALEWIKKAVKIDPKSHHASEWLHVKILEAKIGGEKLINNKFLISTEFGNDVLPKTNLDSAALDKLKFAIYYQLDERVSFIKPKDKIVALLLFELGNVSAIADDVTSALRIYEKAKEYGYESNLLEMRTQKFLSMQASVNNEFNKKKSLFKNYSIPNTIGLVVLKSTVLILIFRIIKSDKKAN